MKIDKYLVKAHIAADIFFSPCLSNCMNHLSTRNIQTFLNTKYSNDLHCYSHLLYSILSFLNSILSFYFYLIFSIIIYWIDIIDQLNIFSSFK